MSDEATNSLLSLQATQLRLARDLGSINQENLEKAGFTKEGFNYYSMGKIYVLLRKSKFYVDIQDDDCEVPVSGVYDMGDLMHLIRLIG